MNIKYLFKYDCVGMDSTMEIEASTLKSAIIIFATKLNDYSDLFMKCINSFDNDDINGLIELFNYFSSSHKIETVYKFIEKYEYKE